MITPTSLVVLSSVALLLAFCRPKNRTRVPLPPGPKKLPIIGSLLVAPMEYQWVKYSEWSKEYGSDIIYLEVAGNSIVVLHSLESITEILNRRSAINPSRPYGIMLSKLMGWDWHFGLLPYGNPWRDRRRVFRQEFNHSNSHNHQATQLKYARRFLRDVLDRPSELVHHCYYTVASSIIEVTYGLPVCPKDDPIIQLSERANRHVNNAGILGTYLVDLIPILQYIPSWFPGAGFQRYAKAAYAETMDMIDIPYRQARDQYVGLNASDG
ncbi:hypothetical protein ONZ45_g5191 [Pleurotus djamor]|nr:hypothetical protein ONZ45_g5191 [Pleurotus djamor]